MVDSPIDWQAVQRAIKAWVVGATELDEDAVVWSHADAPQRERPFVWLNMLTGPVPTAPPERNRYVQPMLQRVTIGAATPGLFSFRVFEGTQQSGDLYSHTAAPGATIATIRAALLAELGAADWPNSGPDADDASSLLLGGTAERPRMHTQVVAGPLTVATVYDGIVDVWWQDVEFTVRLQAETDSQAFGAHARDLAERANAALAMESVGDALREAGLVERRSSPTVDLSRVLNTRHVSRVSRDFVFATRSRVQEDRPWVRQIATPTVALSDGAVTISTP